MKPSKLTMILLGLFLICTTALPSQMVTVVGGTFHNGTSKVTLSSFMIGKYEVTQAEYEAVTGSNPSLFVNNTNRPVDQVSWYNAIEFCNRKSIAEQLTPAYRYIGFPANPDAWPKGWNTDDGNHHSIICDWTADGYRLPTEMEWMFAARSGIHIENFIYSGSNDINAVGWFGGNSQQRTHEVGLKSANKLELHDMSGNIWEWCWDIFRSYEPGTHTNPTGPEGGSFRVLRGGSWISPSTTCTVGHRFSFSPTTTKEYIGFRIARSIVRK